MDSLPSEVWALILDNVSFRDCLQFRTTNWQIYRSMHRLQPRRFSIFESLDEYQIAVKERNLFGSLIQKHSSWSPTYLRAQLLDGALIRVGKDKAIRVQLMFIPMSWIGNRELHFQLSIESQIQNSIPFDQAVNTIIREGVESFSIRLSAERNAGFDSFVMSRSPKRCPQETKRWVEDALRKGYSFRRMVDCTMGYCWEMNSDITLSDAPDESYFEVPHWQSFSVSGPDAKAIGQDQGTAFPIGNPDLISRYLKMIGRRWTRYNEKGLYITSDRA
jgi:hypothetical protein